MRFIYPILAAICILVVLPGAVVIAHRTEFSEEAIYTFFIAWLLIIGWFGGIGFILATIVSWEKHNQKIQDDSRIGKPRNDDIPSHRLT